MKQTHYYFSPYFIIPLIFAGISTFSAVVAFMIGDYYNSLQTGTAWPFFLWSAFVAVAGFICGLMLVRVILRPVEKFVETAAKLPRIERFEPEGSRKQSGDEVARFAEVFDQVKEVLDKVEARQLFPDIIGQSKAIRGILDLIMKVAPTDSTVLISGESGTGKEVVATSIHEHSRRKDKPLITVNCGAIPEGLLESELFGHEKGAFTGAISRKKGKFEMANGGTLFLDEIGDMPLNIQAKVLRSFQEKVFERVGGTGTIKVDVRLIAATNKNLERMVKEGRFRDDLFYRLNVFLLRLPNLRDRKEDIPLLVDHFLQLSRSEIQVSSRALQMLMAYHWPGNVRELQNTIESAVVLSKDDVIEPKHLPRKVTGQIISQASIALPEDASIDEKLLEMEKIMIVESLEKTGGIQIKAAQLLGIKERSLWHRIKKHGINVAAIKNK